MDTGIIQALEYISPDDYQTWTQVGMALKHEGFDVSAWDVWSQGSRKYKHGECEKKWRSFGERSEIVTAGTIIQMAKENGYRPISQQTFGWDDEVEEIGLDYKLIDTGFIKETPLPRMRGEPIDDLRDYLTELFEPDECVGYCDRLTNEDDHWIPKEGIRSRTAGELIECLKKGFDDASICSESEGGAMIRFNPLDGNGESDGNVTALRYCLVESDVDTPEKQFSLYHEMKLPIKVLVHSGNKSLHAIIHVDAATPRIYKERVNFIYEFCEKNGLKLDKNDKNASRYSRMPGIKRGNKYQYIIEMNTGFPNYDEWRKWVDEQNDNLPDDVTLADVIPNMPPLKDELISGILRVGHKMLLSAPSKAGKSFLLMNLAICFAEGLEWIGYQCKQGRVLYVNLELDEASCFHRFKEIYDRMGLEPKNANNLTIWNLRGRAVPMDKLTPFLINRFKNKGYVAVIIDPIYKVIVGDENNATEMSQFCSYFDRAAIEIDAAMIYCHHHSKGAGHKYTNAADRSSGSGVFARDPDAILDMVQINAEGVEDKYREQVPDATDKLSAWEMSSTLREFPPQGVTRLWFDFPLHRLDEWNFLAEAKYLDTGQRGVGKDQKTREDIAEELEALFDLQPETNEAVSREQILDELGITDTNLKKHTTPKTNFEPATLSDGTKVVIRRGHSIIGFKGNYYTRPERRNDQWRKMDSGMG